MDEITKKKVIMITIVPSLVLCLLDVMTTYFGVCIWDGIELNYTAIVISQKYGYMFLSVYHVAKSLFVGSLLAFYLWKARGDELSRIFLIVVLVLYLTDFANVVVLNVNTLMYQNFGVGFAPSDEHAKGISENSFKRLVSVFDRSEFCRLV